MSAPAIRATGLAKSYGAVRALRGLDLTVAPGEVVGYLGPNGSGKTPTVRLLLGLARPDAGRAEVADFDVIKQPQRVRARIGVTGHGSAIPARIHLNVFVDPARMPTWLRVAADWNPCPPWWPRPANSSAPPGAPRPPVSGHCSIRS